VSFTDGFWHHGRRVSLKQSENLDDRGEGMDLGMLKVPLTGSGTDSVKRTSSRLLANDPDNDEEVAYYPRVVADNEHVRVHDAVRRGKLKLCRKCGEVMTRSSRMILSVPSAVLLVVLGSILMVLYGLATNFYQTPWFAKFLLPAAYYIGSIFVGVGLLFFFIRERIWYCGNCREVDKR
jgi:hypothetical protein